ncbi:DUF6883 domain-containing protein [Pontibacter sp. BAB1700]|uniref:DUF6883 domain-containing protein n=1 Tax=Pontibacter sp. BAB1700 TaxID=1144253 RepID=UPI0012DF3E84|nr:DUF6883 domain-containing protein [Pontibacter sp. BAB1700]
MPGRERAIVEDSKVLDYLLNTAHPDGMSKALFFMAHGFNPDNAKIFKEALVSHCFSYEVAQLMQTKFGVKYIIEGEINTPRKTKVNIRTVWIATIPTRIPKLVTAYPIKL